MDGTGRPQEAERKVQTTSYSLSELLRRAKEGSLTIPRFQRKFVWRSSQVKLLVDSISRSYPIGSLLLLDEKPGLKLASRSIEAEIRDDYPPDGVIQDPSHDRTEVKSYILDGQQQTTSIARVFLNAHPGKCYYFDLKRMFESRGREDTAWIRERQRGKKEPPDRKDKGRLLRADVILNQTKADIFVSEYIEDSGDFPQFAENRREGRKAAAHIKGVFETMRNYKVPIVTLERESGIESICRVFETINSTGTRLTTFDLAVARFFPKPDLGRLWEGSQDEYRLLREFEVDGERVLQVLFLVVSTRNGKYPDPTRSNLLALTPDEIEREWDRSAKCLARTYQWARDYGARPKTLPNHNVLVSMAAVRSLFHKDTDDEEVWKDHDLIRRWYFSKVMQAGASQASNYRIGLDFNALREYVERGKKPDAAAVNLNADSVLDLKLTDVRYKALQNIFAMTIREDLLTGRKVDSRSVLHDHHVFPRNARKRYELRHRLLDGICNRVPVLAESNQSLGEGYPCDYLKKMADDARFQGTLEGLGRRLRDCMIPGDPRESTWADGFAVDKFEEFCRKRSELIVGRVREIVGDSLRSDPSSGEGEEDEE